MPRTAPRILDEILPATWRLADADPTFYEPVGVPVFRADFGRGPMGTSGAVPPPRVNERA